MFGSYILLVSPLFSSSTNSWTFWGHTPTVRSCSPSNIVSTLV